MIPKLTSAEYVKDHTIRVRFADGVVGDVNLESELWGEVFEVLRDPDTFRRFRLDDELNTITWPSGADFAPEAVRSESVRPAGCERMTTLPSSPASMRVEGRVVGEDASERPRPMQQTRRKRRTADGHMLRDGETLCSDAVRRTRGC